MLIKSYFKQKLSIKRVVNEELVYLLVNLNMTLLSLMPHSYEFRQCHFIFPEMQSFKLWKKPLIWILAKIFVTIFSSSGIKVMECILDRKVSIFCSFEIFHLIVTVLKLFSDCFKNVFLFSVCEETTYHTGFDTWIKI